jgi:hypothetical protein
VQVPGRCPRGKRSEGIERSENAGFYGESNVRTCALNLNNQLQCHGAGGRYDQSKGWFFSCDAVCNSAKTDYERKAALMQVALTSQLSSVSISLPFTRHRFKRVFLVPF